MSLIARHLEQHGIATVVLGCARDIVERARVPRFVWSDFPLGNSAGRPHDAVSQTATVSLALRRFDDARVPGETTVSPQRWSDDDTWKRDYLDLSVLDAQTLRQLRAEHAAQRSVARELKGPPGT